MSTFDPAKHTTYEPTPPMNVPFDELRPRTVVIEKWDYTPLTFGKYRGKTPLDVAAIDPSYVRWMHDNVEDHPTCSRKLRDNCESRIDAERVSRAVDCGLVDALKETNAILAELPFEAADREERPAYDRRGWRGLGRSRDFSGEDPDDREYDPWMDNYY